MLGAGKNAVRFSPPLVLTRAQADTAVRIFDEALDARSERATRLAANDLITKKRQNREGSTKQFLGSAFVNSRVLRALRDQLVTCALERLRCVSCHDASARVALGKTGEDLACAELERRGYAIVARRYRRRGGEIDIIARDGPTMVFVEVKARDGRAFGDGAPRRSPGLKRRRITPSRSTT